MANSVIKRTFSAHIINRTLSHKFHPYSILTGQTRVVLQPYSVLMSFSNHSSNQWQTEKSDRIALPPPNIFWTARMSSRSKRRKSAVFNGKTWQIDAKFSCNDHRRCQRFFAYNRLVQKLRITYKLLHVEMYVLQLVSHKEARNWQ
jgi:hypothetical protein